VKGAVKADGKVNLAVAAQMKPAIEEWQKLTDIIKITTGLFESSASSASTNASSTNTGTQAPDWRFAWVELIECLISLPDEGGDVDMLTAIAAKVVTMSDLITTHQEDPPEPHPTRNPAQSLFRHNTHHSLYLA
jgi:hypothetical protein